MRDATCRQTIEKESKEFGFWYMDEAIAVVANQEKWKSLTEVFYATVREVAR